MSNRNVEQIKNRLRGMALTTAEVQELKQAIDERHRPQQTTFEKLKETFGIKTDKNYFVLSEVQKGKE